MNRTRLAVAGACVALGVMGQTAPSFAANMPQIGSIPAWVAAPPAIPNEKDSVKGLPLTIRLNDTQFSFEADGWTEFHEVVGKVQTAAGLQALSAIPFEWSPWSDTLTFHRAQIMRDGQVIDILPKDGAFTVLRRETGLEQAMLTGELTALLQPDGLQVGDVLEIAVSVRHADPLLKGQASALFTGWDSASVGLMRLQAHWPTALDMRWRETAGLPPLRRSEAGGVTTVALTLEDVRPPVLPAHAPARFQHGRQVEFTNLADWKDVAKAMAPLYAKAAELSPQSQVAVEAKRIAASSADPMARAGAALRLVQGEVRYLAHAEAGGGYAPQSADETWRLRYGDCKAKSVLLLALLHELGVPAEPVLASTTNGDGLNANLPSTALFNHVLVRVTLGGRDYWLDGTRQGDDSLDDLTTLAHGWVLPLDSPDGQLIRVVPAPASRPQMLQVIRYDTSGGVTAPEPTQLETTFRGDAGFLLHTQLSAIAPDRMDAALKAYWASAHTAFTAAHVAATWNPVKGEETLTADGTSKLDWSGSGLELQNVALGGAPDIKRDPAANDPDAPYVVPFPSYVETEESVVLPPGDSPSPPSLKAADVDTTIAGIAYHRTATLTGHVLRVVTSQRALQPEISAAEARASVDPLTKLGNESVYAPAGPSTKAANDASWIDSHPTNVDGHLSRGEALLDAFRFNEAISEFDAAIALDPKSQLAWADRAISRACLSDPGALADADKADALGLPEIVAARARGVFAANIGHVEEARAAYRRALMIAPDDKFTLARLIALDTSSGDFDAAFKELDHLVRVHPEMAKTAPIEHAFIEQKAGRREAAERDLARAPTDTADELFESARIYLALNDKDLARADLDAAIRLKPSAAIWLLRAEADGGYASVTADTDVDEALKLVPNDMDAQIWKVNAATHRLDYAAALSMMNRLVNDHAEVAGNLLVGRAQIERELGLKTQMDADFARAQAATGAAAPQPVIFCTGAVQAKWRPETTFETCQKALQAAPTSVNLQLDYALLLHRIGREAELAKAIDSVEASAHDAEELNSICYSLAVENIALDRALADCDASLKMRKGDAATLDSRGFVLLRLGRNEEAISAYDAALSANPKSYNSLYGRGVVEARLGRSADHGRDTAAALAGLPNVAKKFEEMGIQ